MPRIRKQRVSDDTLAASRKLRRELTPAEKELWRRLRNAQLGGFKFRRQMAIGKYVVDFACPAARVVVEIDGDTHDGREAYDAERTGEIEKEWWRVIRFMNSDVHRNIDLVLNTILGECQKTIRPSP